MTWVQGFIFFVYATSYLWPATCWWRMLESTSVGDNVWVLIMSSRWRCWHQNIKIRHRHQPVKLRRRSVTNIMYQHSKIVTNMPIGFSPFDLPESDIRDKRYKGNIVTPRSHWKVSLAPSNGKVLHLVSKLLHWTTPRNHHSLSFWRSLPYQEPLSCLE